MKHIITLLMMFLSVSLFAQYRTTYFNTAIIVEDTYYWDDWTASNLKLDIENKVIKINSVEKQIYVILDLLYKKETTNSIRVAYKAVDKNGKRVTIRFEFYDESKNQIYIDYSDISFSYIFIYEN